MSPANPSYVWLAARARNALRRRALVSITSGVVFVGALIGLVLMPRQTTRTRRTVTYRTEPRPDTTDAAVAFAAAARSLHTADSSLAAARRAMAPAQTAPAPADTLSPAMAAQRDSLTTVLAALNANLARAAESPLPPAFKALGETQALQGDPRVRVWLDSLDQVDKLRAPFGALGAGDPIYVALTARVNELGRSIRDAATQRRADLRSRLAAITASTTPAPAPPAAVHVDTTRLVAAQMDAARAYALASHRLDSVRSTNARIDTVTERERELANVGAPPLAMLGAALVIALFMGFFVALVGEVRHPRLAHVREGEAVSGARVLAVIQPTRMVDRGRRKSDRDAPPLIDIVSESYRALYMSLAATGESVPIVTVTGDMPPVVATVAANLAAVAAHEARSTLLVDADPAVSGVASVLRIPADPGLTGVLAGKTDLVGAVVSTTIGRDRPLDVLPSGNGRLGAATPDAVRTVRETLTRMERRYDFIAIAAPTSYVQLATNTIIPVPDVVVCARVGVTRLDELRAEVKSLRGIGRYVHGVVLWDAEAPRV
jgi:Mrp family chromosome partitioning ATPase